MKLSRKWSVLLISLLIMGLVAACGAPAAPASAPEPGRLRPPRRRLPQPLPCRRGIARRAARADADRHGRWTQYLFSCSIIRTPIFLVPIRGSTWVRCRRFSNL